MLTARLKAEFPRYAELTSPTPLTIPETQRLLGMDEALIVFLTADDASFVWAVTRENAVWQRVPMGGTVLGLKVSALLRGIDNELLGKWGGLGVASGSIEGTHPLFQLDPV
jgi:hypothetical protein